MSQYNHLLSSVVDISREAGGEIMAIYKTGFSIVEKSDRSPLTEADMAAHHVIVDSLANVIPDTPILSEESANIPYETRSQWHTYWLVDPLDGTREFIKRNGEFTVNIALIEGNTAVMGVIYAPVPDTTYAACKGHGAWKQQGKDPRNTIKVRPFPTSKVIVAGSRSHSGDSLKGFLDRIGEHDLVSMGSSLKSCLVAEGSADVYPRFGPTSEWDTAAAQTIVEEAGGLLTTLDLKPLRYNTKDSLLNPEFIVIGDIHHDWDRLLT